MSAFDDLPAQTVPWLGAGDGANSGRARAGMADVMVVHSLRAELAQLRAEKESELAKLRYDLALERGEKDRLGRVAHALGARCAELEADLGTTSELLRLERQKTTRLGAALVKAKAMRDRMDAMRHEMQRGVTVAFNQLSRAAVALDGEMKDFFAHVNRRDGWDFDADVVADVDEAEAAAESQPPRDRVAGSPRGAAARSLAPAIDDATRGDGGDRSEDARARAEAAEAATSFDAWAARARGGSGGGGIGAGAGGSAGFAFAFAPHGGTSLSEGEDSWVRRAAESRERAAAKAFAAEGGDPTLTRIASEY